MKKEPITGDRLKKPANFLRFTGLATQMLGTILIFTVAGYKADIWLANKVPVCTIILSLLSIAGSLYMLVKGLQKNK